MAMDADEQPKPTRRFSRRRLLVVLAAMVLLVAVVVLLRGDAVPDPALRGHSPGYYVDQLPATWTTGGRGHSFYPPFINVQNLTQQEQAEQMAAIVQQAKEASTAVELIGSKGFPWLLEQIGQEVPVTQNGLSKSPPWIQNQLLKLNIRVSPTPAYLKRWQSVTAVHKIYRAGADMTPIMPDLLILVTNTDPDIKLAASFLIGQIDSPRLDELEGQEKLAAIQQ